jgi:hypothetical protein
VNEKKYKIVKSPNGNTNVVSSKMRIKVPKNKTNNVNAFLKNYFSHPKINIVKKIKGRKNIGLPYKLNCSAVNTFYQNSTNNGRTGHVLTSLNTTKRLGTIYNSSLGIKKIRRGIAVLGHGKQAVVYLGCTDKSCRQKLIIKVSPFDKSFSQDNQPSEYEYRVHRQIFKVAPKHVTAIFSLKRCRNFASLNAFTQRRTSEFDYEHQTVSFGEYLEGGELYDWLNKVKPNVTDDDIAQMIFQILKTLQKIRVRYPDFRHHDLHLQNVLVDDTGKFPRLAIADFGLAQISKQDPNPMIAKGFYESSGITSNSDVKYDHHFFLNSLYSLLHSWTSIPKTNEFLKFALPETFRGPESVHVTSWRLRNKTDTRNLPSLLTLLNNPYLRKIRESPSLSRSVSTPRAFVVNRNAADIARNILSGNTNVSVVTRVKPTAKNFLKLSPASRLALKRPGNKEVKPKLIKFNVKPRVTAAGPTLVRPSPTRLSPSVFRNRRFNAKVLANLSPGNTNYYNKWNRARTRTVKALTNRVRRGLSPFNNAGPSRRNARTVLNLVKSPGGRVRSKGKLLMSRTKAELVNLAKNVNVNRNWESLTKQKIINALYG